MSSSTPSKSNMALGRIAQGQCRRAECEIKFKNILRRVNNEVTAAFPILDRVMLGNDPIDFELIPDPILNATSIEDTILNNKVASMITQRVKDDAERKKAIITKKAPLLSSFKDGLEYYIESAADPTRSND